MKYLTQQDRRHLPTFWLGMASLFDFTGSIPAGLTQRLNAKTVQEALRADARQVAQDMRRVFDRETSR